jgi:predicted AAA+ superfamily ATPase
MNFYRNEFYVLKKRLEENRSFIQVLTGPRQAGKTTIAQQLTQELKIPCHFSSADYEAGSQVWIDQQWEIARIKSKEREDEPFILILDEVQKISDWSRMIKAQWDKDTNDGRDIRLLILGSSRLLLQQGLTESLTGRFEIVPITHWTFSEMKTAFGMEPEEYVWFGGYPGAMPLINDEYRWKDYIRNAFIETTLSKDILQMKRIDKPALLRQLFEIGCRYSGQVLSLSKMLGQLQDAGNTVTLSNYLLLLDQAGMLTGLQKFGSALIRQKASSPKFQVYNNALITSQMQIGFNSVIKIPGDWGRLVESAIGAHLINSAIKSKFQVLYWRDRNDEVDFVLRKGSHTIAIEVKTGNYRKSGGMNAFRNKFKPDRILLVSSDGMTWKEFLESDPAKFFEA